MLLLARAVVGGRGLALGFGQRLVDDLVESLPVDYFDKGHAVRFAGDHPDGRRVLDADALAKIDVRLDFCGQLLLRIDDKGQAPSRVAGQIFRRSCG